MILATLYHCSLATKDVTQRLTEDKLYIRFLDQSFVNSYEAVAAGASVPIILSDMSNMSHIAFFILYSVFLRSSFGKTRSVWF